MVLFGKICRVQLLSFSLTKISVFGHYDTILGRGVGGKIELNPVVGNSDRDLKGREGGVSWEEEQSRDSACCFLR